MKTEKQEARFPLGKLVTTPGALKAVGMDEINGRPNRGRQSDQYGEWSTGLQGRLTSNLAEV